MRGIDELDYYELLEVARNATGAELDRAYRTAQDTYANGSLAMYSVFESRDATEIRSRFDEAYRVLSDAELREAYDAEIPAETKRTGSDAFRDVVDAASVPGDAEIGNYEQRELAGFDPVEQLSPLDAAVEEYDALEDDGSGEFDGVRLRRNRLFRGYELEQIADVTKVSRTHLRNIEEENFGELPADVYVRGFVTAYAQTIGLDPRVVVPSYMARVQGSRSTAARGGFLARR